MNKCLYKAGVTALLLSVFLLHGCSSTRVTGVWKKSDYLGGPFATILVVGLTYDQSTKNIWEDVMADQLRKNGVKTTTSTRCFPGDPEITKDKILDYVSTQGIEGVLVTRLVDVLEETRYYPPTASYYSGYYYGGHRYRYYNHFGTYYDMVYSPGYTATYTRVLLETNLYDAATQELVWSMSSDTFDPDSTGKLAQSVSRKVIESLQKDNLITSVR
ncbi:MAG: hypothetical protein SCH71_05730 [Desulfobulbaceae bacterium]|nr:hypothetical protein [Desulfobulbaceae bacterium]